MEGSSHSKGYNCEETEIRRRGSGIRFGRQFADLCSWVSSLEDGSERTIDLCPILGLPRLYDVDFLPSCTLPLFSIAFPFPVYVLCCMLSAVCCSRLLPVHPSIHPAIQQCCHADTEMCLLMAIIIIIIRTAKIQTIPSA
jgi:hypothetical protein